MTRTVGCRARGRPLRRLRTIAGTREVSARGPRLGRAWTPRPNPGPAAAGKMSPAALRNGDPCRPPVSLSPYPSWLSNLHLVTAPHSIAQSSRPGSGMGVATHYPCRYGAMERAPPPNLVVCLVSPHQYLGTDVQTLLYQRDPGHSSADPASYSIPLLQPPTPTRHRAVES